MSIDTSLIIAIAGGIATVSTAVGIIHKVVKSTITKYSKESMKDAVNIYSNRMTKDIDELKNSLNEYIKNSDKNDAEFKQFMTALARDRINQAHKHYMSEKSIDRNTLLAIESLYTSYKHLGGNGYVEDLMEDIRDIKIV